MSESKENANEEKPADPVFSIGDVIAGYVLVQKIDEGGFGQVFKVTKEKNKEKNKEFYAMKLENNFQEGGSAIKLEINVLNQLPRDTVFPRFICGGKRARYHYLVLELLGDNLKTLKSRSTNPEVWSDGTWSRIGIQCFYAMKKMHEAGFVHRDLKPNNFAIGINTASELRSRRVLLFDFGLARKFIQKRTGGAVSKKQSVLKVKKSQSTAQPSTSNQKTKGNHKLVNPAKEQQRNLVHRTNDRLVYPQRSREKVSAKTDKKASIEEIYEFRKPRPRTDFRGTHQYASPNAHLLKELGRHDDVWSLMYMIAEFFIELPWTSNEDIPIDELKNQACLLRIFSDEKNPNRLTSDMRRQLNEIDRMLKALNYYESPNYELVYQFLKDSMEKAKVDWETPYDWETGRKSGAENSKTAPKLPRVESKSEEWKNPMFFKTSIWEKLPMPTISPPGSSKNLNSRHDNPIRGFRKQDYKSKLKKQMSKEETQDPEEVIPVINSPTPAPHKSMRAVLESAESKKSKKD